MAKKDKITHKKVKGTEMVFRSLSLPAALVEDLKLLRDSYEAAWYQGENRERVTYEKVFERILSKSGLGHIDPDVYETFTAAKKARKEFSYVVTRATRKTVKELAARAERNGTSLKEEAAREQTLAVAEVEAQRSGKTEKRFVHPDGRQFVALPGIRTPFYAKVSGRGNVGQNTLLKEGFELKDVDI